LNGSPTVSPTTVALWSGEPLPYTIVFAGLIVRFAPMISHALGLE
jgi:hypothetical protein